MLTADHMEILDGQFGGRSVREVFRYAEGWELPSPEQRAALVAHMAARTSDASAARVPA